MEFELTGLWQNALGEQAGLSYREARERLRTAYRLFWTNACHLANQIAKDIPALTLHDAAHFEALWDRADQIAGPDFHLTPLEVFVFGGAVLLHDAANSVAAFDGGAAEVEATPEWKDAAKAYGADIAIPTTTWDPDLRQNVLLATLRQVHAKRAEELGNFKVTNAHTKTTTHLISDDQLRTHLGSLIGQIAASHHWDIGDLEAKLPPRVGALSGFPRDWTVRPIVVACLLRSADAVQLDQRRAPDFLMGLLQLRGISEQHWRAQNFLTTPLVDDADPDALIFSSSRPYREADADAWWLAYDALQTAHGELQACSSLLKDLGLPPFRVNRIRGAESPTRLSRTVRTDGWRPISAEVRANRVARIIELFGGSQLYGDEPGVALRELIQNSVDAVRLRRALEPSTSGYTGRITVRLENPDSPNGDMWLVVEDDGLGMSEAGLTGPLIDFGDSYIASRLAQEERPGLSAASVKRIGKFGVGFFTVFMLGEDVRVSSRPFDASLSDVRTLRFRSGLTLRPLLLDAPVNDFSSQLSTRVSVLLSAEKLLALLSPPWGQQRQATSLTLSQFVTGLCPMVDVDIFVETPDSGLVQATSQSWPPADVTRWLRGITLADARAEPYLDKAISAAVSMLRPIDPSDDSAGLAAIPLFGGPGGIMGIGGLRNGSRWGSLSENFIGVMDYEPSGPDRAGGKVRARQLLARWASEQARLAAETDAEPRAKISAALKVADYGGDPTPIAGALLNKQPALLSSIFEALQTRGQLAFVLGGERFGHGDTDNRLVMTTLRINQIDPFMSYFSQSELSLTEDLIEPTADSHRAFWVINADAPSVDTFFGCLVNYVISMGFGLDLESKEISIGQYIGEDSPRDGLSNGMDIVREVGIVKLLSPTNRAS